jgi:Arc/MetJ-type ribon-helix-helix transcriptional regulator
MARSKRILFSFDPRNERNLRELTEAGGFPTASDAVRDALTVARALQSQSQQGFTEVVVRNPATNQERVVVLPSFSVPAPKEQDHGEEDSQLQFSPAQETGEI